MFELFQYPFIQNAFLAGTFVAVAAALLGYFLVIRGLTFAGHALSNIGFAGAAGAVLVGVHPVYGLLAFTVAASLAIGILGREIRERDVAIGVLMTFALGLGVLFLSLYHGYAERAYSILFGTILGISREDVWVTGLFSLAITLGTLVMWRPLLFSSFDPEIAEARGVPLRALAVAFLVIVALTVSVAMQVVGVLLVFALLVGPPATAARLVHRPSWTVSLAVLLGLAYTWMGILLAANSNWPVSFFIAAISFGVYLPVRLFSRVITRAKIELTPGSGRPIPKRCFLSVRNRWAKDLYIRGIGMVDLFRHDFVQNAFLAGTIVAILSGLVGYFVVIRGQSFACEALSHVGFAGASFAALIGLPGLLGMFAFTLLAAVGMGALGNRLRGRDVEIGMVLSFVLGLGVLFLSLYTRNSGAVMSVLFGSILSVARPAVLLTLGIGLAAILALIVLFRPLLFSSVDPTLAESRGIPVQRLSVLFLLLLAVSVSVAVQVVGVLLVFALLIVPAASAELVSNRPLATILLAAGISLASTWAGLAMAFIGHWPVSFYIVAITSFFYFAARAVRHFRAPRHYQEVAHPSREVIAPDE